LDGLPAKFSELVKSCLTKDPNIRPSLRAVGLILSDVSRGDSSGGDVGKANETLIVDRTMLEESVRSGSKLADSEKTLNKLTEVRQEAEKTLKNIRIYFALLAILLAPLIYFYVKDNQDSESRIAPVDEQVVSSTSLESIAPATVPPTTIPVIPEFKLAEYEGRGLRFDPCDGPITVAVNFGTVSTVVFNNVTTWVADAVADVSRESGLEFIFTGATDKVPKGKYRDGRNGAATILIGLLKPGESGTTLIEKGETWGADNFNSIGYKVSGSQWRPIESFDAQINADYQVFEWDIRRVFLQAIGLDYVTKTQYAASQELMAVVESADGNSFTWKKSNSEWGPGDILGMKAVGIKNGCIG